MNANTLRTNESNPPLYCARCRRAAIEGISLCEQCGDSLAPQGYCEICERWWLLAPGTDCPKHDVALAESPEFTQTVGKSGKLVVVATYGLTLEAHGPKLRLEAEGIPAFLDGARMAEHGIYQVATGGVKLLVPEEFATDARILLAQTWAPPKLDDDDAEDDWEGLAPPDAADRRRSVMKKMIVIYLFWPIAAAVVTAVIFGAIQLLG